MHRIRPQEEAGPSIAFPMLQLDTAGDVALANIALRKADLPIPLNGNVLRQGVVLNEKWSCYALMGLSQLAVEAAYDANFKMPPKLTPNLNGIEFLKILKLARIQSKTITDDPS